MARLSHPGQLPKAISHTRDKAPRQEMSPRAATAHPEAEVPGLLSVVSVGVRGECRGCYLGDLHQYLAHQLLPLRVLEAQSQLPKRQGLLEQQAGLGLGWGDVVTKSLGKA